MKYIIDFLNTYGTSIIHSVSIAIISYVSIEIKKIYKNYIEDKTKKEVIKMVCSTIDQIYPNLNNKNKLDRIITNSKQILKEKGILINDLELRIYIENYLKSDKL